MRNLELLVTCEHGGNRVPPEYRDAFSAAGDALASHRGFDAGALALARVLSAALGAELLFAETTRLLVDLNRSVGHPRLFSEFSRGLGVEERQRVLECHYVPYRARVEQAIAAAIDAGGFVLHVSAHSFAATMDGVEREAEIGLLFDPRREAEARIAGEWRGALRAAAPEWRVRRNYPYRGRSDGLTTHLRTRFPQTRYAGIELEVNQRLVAEREWPRHVSLLASVLAAWRDGASPPA